MGRAAAGLAAAVPVAVLMAAAPKVVECPVVVRVAAVRERESQAAWVAGTRVVAARAAVVKAAAWVAEAMAPCVVDRVVKWVVAAATVVARVVVMAARMVESRVAARVAKTAEAREAAWVVAVAAAVAVTVAAAVDAAVATEHHNRSF
jgi:hypothetical protein